MQKLLKEMTTSVALAGVTLTILMMHGVTQDKMKIGVVHLQLDLKWAKAEVVEEDREMITVEELEVRNALSVIKKAIFQENVQTLEMDLVEVEEVEELVLNVDKKAIFQENVLIKILNHKEVEKAEEEAEDVDAEMITMVVAELVSNATKKDTLLVNVLMLEITTETEMREDHTRGKEEMMAVLIEEMIEEKRECLTKEVIGTEVAMTMSGELLQVQMLGMLQVRVKIHGEETMLRPMKKPGMQ